jgi:hypothetical protein
VAEQPVGVKASAIQVDGTVLALCVSVAQTLFTWMQVDDRQQLGGEPHPPDRARAAELTVRRITAR